VQDPVVRATALIRERFAEPLTLDDIAEAAIMSKFHFSRLFRQTTGISPGRFLTAVRLHEAKELLLTSSISVVDISYLIGYTSLGTFTTRFTECVGVSPGKFRRLAEIGLLKSITASGTAPGRPSGSIAGSVRVDPETTSGPIFVGIFDRPLPQGRPSACLVVPGIGQWLIDPVPEGTWFVLAVSLHLAATHCPPRSRIHHPVLVGAGGPIHVRPGSLCSVDLKLHAPRPIDPPILLNLPLLLNLPHLEERKLEEGAAV
jgi:AraC-like DNA-binding protein